MTDDYADLLLFERDRLESAIVEFYQTTFARGSIAVFVESDKADKMFFHAFVRSISSSEELYFFECGSKSAVLETAGKLEAEERPSSLRAILYLCDRDFDHFFRPMPVAPVYYTDYYSVENYLVDCHFFEHVFVKHCGVMRRSQARSIARRLWDLVHDQAPRLRGAFALMCYLRMRGEAVDFNKISLKSIACVERDDSGKINVNLVDGFERAIFPGEIDKGQVQQIEGKMKVSDFRVWFRGKHCWQYVKKLVDALIIDKKVANRLNEMISHRGLIEYGSLGINIVSLEKYIMGRIEK